MTRPYQHEEALDLIDRAIALAEVVGEQGGPLTSNQEIHERFETLVHIVVKAYENLREGQQ